MSSTLACTFSWGPRIPVMNHVVPMFVCAPGLSHFLPHEGASASLESRVAWVLHFTLKRGLFLSHADWLFWPPCVLPQDRGEEGWVVSALRENSEWVKEHSLPFSELCKQSKLTLGFHVSFLWAAARRCLQLYLGLPLFLCQHPTEVGTSLPPHGSHWFSVSGESPGRQCTWWGRSGLCPLSHDPSKPECVLRFC